jgi:hypothetical protein
MPTMDFEIKGWLLPSTLFPEEICFLYFYNNNNDVTNQNKALERQ